MWTILGTNGKSSFTNHVVCRHCGVTKSMEHILLEYQAPGEDEGWNLLENVWPTTAKPFTKPDLGTFMGCGLADFRDEDGKKTHRHV